jgi:hypothetical protein
MALQLATYTDASGIAHTNLYVRIAELYIDRRGQAAQFTVKGFTSRANAATKREVSGCVFVIPAPLGDFNIVGNWLAQGYTWLKANTNADSQIDLSTASDVLE